MKTFKVNVLKCKECIVLMQNMFYEIAFLTIQTCKNEAKYVHLTVYGRCIITLKPKIFYVLEFYTSRILHDSILIPREFHSKKIPSIPTPLPRPPPTWNPIHRATNLAPRHFHFHEEEEGKQAHACERRWAAPRSDVPGNREKPRGNRFFFFCPPPYCYAGHVCTIWEAVQRIFGLRV